MSFDAEPSTEGQKKSEIRMESRLRGLEHLF